MTTDTAERLRIKLFNEFDASLVLEYDQALAAEFQRGYVEGHGAGEIVGYAAGVARERERIRAAVDDQYGLKPPRWTHARGVTLRDLAAILDKEAKR